MLSPENAWASLEISAKAHHILCMVALIVPIVLAVIYGLFTWRLAVWRGARDLDANSTVMVDARLQQLTEQMAQALDRKRIKVHIHEVDHINGLAVADGRIFITRGLFEKYREGEYTAEEVSSVIAHELGHVALGHTRRRMIEFTGQSAIRTVIGMVLNRFIPGIGTLIGGWLMTLVAARLSRDDEFEADAYATALMMSAGIGVAPQKTLFAKFDDMIKTNVGSTPAWLLSHPKTAKRIAAIEANEAKWMAT